MHNRIVSSTDKNRVFVITFGSKKRCEEIRGVAFAVSVVVKVVRYTRLAMTGKEKHKVVCIKVDGSRDANKSGSYNRSIQYRLVRCGIREKKITS